MDHLAGRRPLAIRRLLIAERKVDKSSLNLMGYWREGRVLD